VVSEANQKARVEMNVEGLGVMSVSMGIFISLTYHFQKA